MEKKIILCLIILCSQRRLQEANVKFKAIAFSKKRSITLIHKNKEVLCNLKIKEVNLYKSIYCFRKIEKKSSFNYVMTTSLKKRKTRAQKKMIVIYISLKKWGKLYFPH